MRVVRVGNLAQYFTSNELSGWPDGIRYEYLPRPKRQRLAVEATPVPHPSAVIVIVGKQAKPVEYV